MSWFEVHEFPGRIFRIREPALAPLHGSNAWLLVGARASLVIDTGVGVAPLRPALDGIAQNPTICLLTHTHYDHIGGAHEFADRCAHRAEAAKLADPDPKSTRWEGWLTESSFRRFPSSDFNFVRYAITPAPPTRLVEDRERIDLGDRVLTILHTPGHSPGLLSVFEELTGALFTSDALYDGPMFFDLEGSNRADAARSIARLMALDASIVHPGHFESLSREEFLRLGAETLGSLRKGG